MNPPDSPFGPTGTLTKEDGRNVIRFTRLFAARPDRVWQAISTADGLSAWLAPRVAIDPRLGGMVEFEFDADNIVSGTITHFDPPLALGHEWTINGEHESHVMYELSDHPTGCHLTLTHIGLPDDMCGGYTPGWHAHLVRIDAFTRGEEPPEWMAVFERVLPSYQT